MEHHQSAWAQCLQRDNEKGKGVWGGLLSFLRNIDSSFLAMSVWLIDFFLCWDASTNELLSVFPQNILKLSCFNGRKVAEIGTQCFVKWWYASLHHDNRKCHYLFIVLRCTDWHTEEL